MKETTNIPTKRKMSLFACILSADQTPLSSNSFMHPTNAVTDVNPSSAQLILFIADSKPASKGLFCLHLAGEFETSPPVMN